MRALPFAFAVALLFSATALAQYAPQSAGPEPLSPELEERVQRLGKELRCAVCQGMSIADSPASMARAQLDVVRTLVKEGRTDEEIKQYFVERYGEWALLEPKKEGTNLLLWLGPAVLLLGGAGFVFWFALRHKGATPADAAAPSTEAAPASAAGAQTAQTAPAEVDPYLAAVRSELER